MGHARGRFGEERETASEMEAAAAAPSSPSPPPLDPRVKCRSRCRAVELLGGYEPFLGKLGTGQPVEAESLEQAVGEALWVRAAAGQRLGLGGCPAGPSGSPFGARWWERMWDSDFKRLVCHFVFL